MSHAYHPSLEGYKPTAVLTDGCHECEERSKSGLEGLLALDEERVGKLWLLMRSTKLVSGPLDEAGREAARGASECDLRLVDTLYRVYVFMERYWTVLAGVGR